MPKCPFDDPSFSIGYDTPCPLCGALGGDDSDDITAKCAAAIVANDPLTADVTPALESCASCDVNLADPPSKLCPGCQAYREHLL